MQNSKKAEDQNSNTRNEEKAKVGNAEKATGPAMGDLPLTSKKDDQQNFTGKKAKEKEKPGSDKDKKGSDKV